MRRHVALLLGAVAFAATLAPQASANPYCSVGPATAIGPACTAKCLLLSRPGSVALTCLWQD